MSRPSGERLLIRLRVRADPGHRVDARGFAVDLHLEVVGLQAAHRAAGLIDHASVDDEARHVDALAEPGRPLRRVRAGAERADQRGG